MAFLGCTANKVYSNSSSGYTFKYSSNQKIVEDDSSITISLSDEITVAVFSNDVKAFADPYYLSFLKQNELTLQSGAFEANYNNTLYISKLLDYLFSDSDKGYTIYGIHRGTFNLYNAWCANILSQNNDVNGSIYICVENGRSYIICIYIKDQYENRHNYDGIINKFIKSFKITDVKEEK